MPRVDEKYLDCSLYLYSTEADAMAGRRLGGSGFLALVDGIEAGKRHDAEQFATPDYAHDYYHFYAVTNRHVANKHPVIRLNKLDGKFDVIPKAHDDWVMSDEHDLAVAPIDFNPAHRYLFVSVIGLFLTKELTKAQDIGIGDEVFMVGRLVNHEGTQRNLPSMRCGHISMMPYEPVYHPSNRSQQQESFLVEIHSISGYSGSPVFVRPFPSPKLPINPISDDSLHYSPTLPAESGRAPLAGGPWLLGIDWGYINNHDQRQNNTGVSAVVPAWHITELLNFDLLVRQRQEEQEERKRRKG